MVSRQGFTARGRRGVRQRPWATTPGCSDPRLWLWWQLELELLDQEPEFRLRLGVAGQQQLPPVGRRQMNIDHLDGRDGIPVTRLLLSPALAGSAPIRFAGPPFGNREGYFTIPRSAARLAEA
jgi:hypothetical protein